MNQSLTEIVNKAVSCLELCDIRMEVYHDKNRNLIKLGINGSYPPLIHINTTGYEDIFEDDIIDNIYDQYEEYYATYD